ncbi:sulfoxide reductase heme-binding subunit YedZ [Pseudomonadales bacterium]|nr:sulfoxide reductase heme-binding subunit YedZ [Pseudomonadales bacterium]
MLSKQRKLIKTALLLLALTPLALMIEAAIGQALGPDPAEALADQTGEWALRLLCACLAITPLRIITGKVEWLRYRRMLGLLAFFYACLHLAVYWVFILRLQWADFFYEFAQRPYIAAGMAALLLLVPLAITSTKKWQRKLGRQWPRLHRLVYLATVLALTHVWWQTRSDYTEALTYTLILLALGIIRFRRKRWFK